MTAVAPLHWMGELARYIEGAEKDGSDEFDAVCKRLIDETVPMRDALSKNEPAMKGLAKTDGKLKG